jgi:hypothetical protein
LSRLEVLWADGAYTSGSAGGPKKREVGTSPGAVPSGPAASALYGLKEKPRGFLGIAERRWVVERTLAWLGKARRLAKDYERLPETGVAMIHAAMSRIIMVRRLTRAPC